MQCSVHRFLRLARPVPVNCDVGMRIDKILLFRDQAIKGGEVLLVGETTGFVVI